jgi:DNA-binding MarR family transcriptional regulator
VVPVDSTVEVIDDALTRLVRHGMVPRTQAAIAARSGVPVERSTYVLLRRLAERAPIRLSDLAADLGLDVSTVSRQVARLAERRLVRRLADPVDGRAGRLELTARGRDLLQRVRRGRHTWLADAVGDWSETDRVRLAQLLDRLADALGPTVPTAAG